MTTPDPAPPGARFGARTVLREAIRDKWGKRRVMVRCDCGTESAVRVSDLTSRGSSRCKPCWDKQLHRSTKTFTAGGRRRTCTDPGSWRTCADRECALWLDHHHHSCAADVGAEGCHTLSEIGEYMGLTRERIRQIEVEALAKLKRQGDAGVLWALGFEHGWRKVGCRMMGRRVW